MSDGLSQVVDLLRCPVCGDGYRLELPDQPGVPEPPSGSAPSADPPTLPRGAAGPALTCAQGHAVDVARQGYVTLSRSGIRHDGDTAAMLDARDRVQRTGFFDPVRDAVVALAGVARTVVDVGGGNGWYAAALADAVDGRRLLVLDSSAAAAKRAARVHPRVGAVRADLADALPLADGAADLALVIFAPRPAAELARVVRPGGHLLVVTPAADHLSPLVDALGLLSITQDKLGELGVRLGDAFSLLERRRVHTVRPLSPERVVDVVMSGPNAFHRDTPALGDEIAAALQRGSVTRVGELVPVTLAADVTSWQRRP